MITRGKRIIWGFFCALFVWVQVGVTVSAEGEAAAELSLYATSAVLLDADSGRVLYGKNADAPMAMASTTKIMTCIVVLEQVEDLGEMVTVSAYASSMPKVKLYIKQGEQYQVRELLFSLMLESHNDAAVALAEYVGKRYLGEELKNKDTATYTAEESKQAVAAFAALMNEKARELGCTETHYITPNGLDATETITLETGETVQKEHHTTATELARIMSYCIKESVKRDLFLEITRTPSYSFTRNNRSFTCANHNSFLTMMDGALSGKTGFTNKAGYCYVGALQRDDRTFVVALLACGWPNNKSYKWSDTKEMMQYGLDYYNYRDYAPKVSLQEVYVEGGVIPNGSPYESKYIAVTGDKLEEPLRLLTTEKEQVVVRVSQKDFCQAPVRAGDEAGSVSYYLREENGEETLIKELPLYFAEDVKRLDFSYILRYIWEIYSL
ncbi:MAG: D-alanyl-D-alanine carboxypeptidase [Lachnospiraceae bacterium]|nr:D-alanyl-D-alanine carboxypeptidase [Lachnospiraceae bacterium]